jgi:hypothetical protein
LLSTRHLVDPDGDQAAIGSVEALFLLAAGDAA